MKEEFSVKIHGRGESATYTNGATKVDFEMTWCNGHRIYCDSLSTDDRRRYLSWSERKSIIENLCSHFKSISNELTYVIDIRDRDSGYLRALFIELKQNGHKISVENDSAEERENAEDEAWIKWLEAGKALELDGCEIHTVEQYYKWKAKQS